MDTGLSCFVPGKVLDLSFNVLNMIRDYVKRDIHVQLNAINVMRDIRDYSTMATEHFDLSIAPLLNKRLQDPSYIRRSLDGGRYFSPMIRSTTNMISSVYNFTCLPSPNDYESEYVSTSHVNKISEQVDAQSKQIEDMRKLVNVQNNVILHIGEVLNEVTKYIPPVQSNSFSAMIEKLNSSSASLQEMLNTPPSIKAAPTSARETPADWLLKRSVESLDSSGSSNGVMSTPKTRPSKVSDAFTHTLRYSLRNRQTPPGNFAGMTSSGAGRKRRTTTPRRGEETTKTRKCKQSD